MIPILGFVLATSALAASTPAFAEIRIPSGAALQLARGTVNLGCTDLEIAGKLVQGAEVSTVGARNVQINSGGQLELGGGSLQLSQDFTNAGTVLTGGGNVTRVDSAQCPAKGALGVVNTNEVTVPTSATAVPSLQTYALALLSLMLAAAGCIRSRRF